MAMTPNEFRNFIATRDDFVKVLAEETAKRKFRQMEDWRHYEQTAMLKAVNRERDKRGRTFVSPEQIAAIDSYSTGSDWSAKFALRCAELVFKD